MCFKSPWATVCSKIYSGYQHRKHLSLILLACWTPSIKGQKYRSFHVMIPYWAVKYLISLVHPMLDQLIFHEDAIKWKHFPRYWPFVRGIHRSPMNSPHKGQWRGALMFSLSCAWRNCWVNNQDACVLRRHRAHYDVIVMSNARQNSIIPQYTSRSPHVSFRKKYCDYSPQYKIHACKLLTGKHHSQYYHSSITIDYSIYQCTIKTPVSRLI